MNPNTNTNYLTNSLAKAQQFAGKVASELRSSIYQSKYGYGSNEGSVLTSAQNIGKEPAKVAATAVGDVLTNKSLKLRYPLYQNILINIILFFQLFVFLLLLLNVFLN